MRQHTVSMQYLGASEPAHFYSTEINGELALFDAGTPTIEALDYLQREIDLPRLKYLFITHYHMDHCGLAPYIAANTDARIFIPRLDVVRALSQDNHLALFKTLLIEYGFDEEFCRQLMEGLVKNKMFLPLPERYEIAEESEIPARLGVTCLSCPSHSQSDLIYMLGKYAVTGDVLLRNIFQVPLLEVDLASRSGRFRNYDAHCASLIKLQALRGCEILPGHRSHVKSLEGTILFYVKKMMQRAVQIKRCAGIETVRGVIDKLSRSAVLDPMLVYLKASEVVFMRDFLAEPHRLKESLVRIGLFDAVCGLYTSVLENPLSGRSAHGQA
ncbi:MAG: MBL fold metallo-hydrolase [Geobacteraceae bacterium]